MTKFTAKGILVLRCSGIPDRSGDAVSQDCIVELPPHGVPILFENEGEPVGTADLYRQGRDIYANLRLTSTMKPAPKALALIRELFPSVSGQLLEIEPQDNGTAIITSMRVDCISLGPHGNADESVPNLGDRVVCLTGRRDLH